jgi:hypothetical protein
MLQAWFFCPLVTFYALVRQKLVLEPAALWGSLAGLIMFFAFYNFSRSLRRLYQHQRTDLSPELHAHGGSCDLAPGRTADARQSGRAWPCPHRSAGTRRRFIPVAQLGFVFTAVLGRMLFAETLSWRKRGGLVVAAAAMVTLEFS